MSSSFDLNAILSQMGRDKGIDKQVLIEAVESAMLSAIILTLRQSSTLRRERSRLCSSKW
jgi:hypothetical protein